MNKIFGKKGEKKIGQSEVLVAALFVLLLSGVVVAQNVTNITNITGDFILDEAFENLTNSTQIIEETKTIEVFANSYLEIPLEKTEFQNNESILIQARLSLDDGSFLGNQNIDFFIDGYLIGSDVTDSSGLAELGYYLSNETEGAKTVRVEFFGRDYINPSSAEMQITVKPSVYNWITYDPKSDIIKIVGDDEHCTATDPCTLTDIYNADQANGWGQMENLYNYFLFNAGLQIGDGEKETWVVSEFEHVYITKPWEVMANANLRFGFLSESDQPAGGVLFETDVSKRDQLRHNSALKIDMGGSLFFYDSVYKVYSQAENDIYLETGSAYEADRFDIQRIEKFSAKTTLHIPEKSLVKDFVKRVYAPVLCENEETCERILGGDT